LLGVQCETQVNDSGNDGPNVVMEMSAAGRSAYGGNVSYQVTGAWVNAPGLDQPVERIAFINGTPRQRQVFHADGLGSIAVLTDESGATVQTYTYAAFGSIRTQTGTDLNRVTFTAREALGDSLELYYYRNRVLDPHTGRFTSEDPLGFVDGASRYVYVGNNPVNMVDPKGEFEVLSTLAAAAVVYSAYKLFSILADFATQYFESVAETRSAKFDAIADPNSGYCGEDWNAELKHPLGEIKQIAYDAAMQQYVYGPLTEAGSRALNAGLDIESSVRSRRYEQLRFDAGMVRNAGYKQVANPNTRAGTYFRRPPRNPANLGHPQNINTTYREAVDAYHY